MLSLLFVFWQIYIFRSFVPTMLISGVGFNQYKAIYSSFNPLQTRQSSVSFEGGRLIDLNYVLKNRKNLLPERVLNKVEEIVKSNPSKMPTLKQVHQEIYSPLLDCKTLEEAQKMFPEFSSVKEANISFQRYTKNIKKILENKYFDKNFSLKMLQECWANLRSKEEIVKEMGLDSRTSLDWVLQKINFVNCTSNYRTLIKASDPESRKIIAAKTTAWNAAHPDLMKARNKHAAQYMKKPENREAHSERMKEHFRKHPERRKQISENSKEYWSDSKHREEQSKRGLEYEILHPEKRVNNARYQKMVWEKIPEIRLVMANFFKDYVAEDKILAARLRYVFNKRQHRMPLTPAETAMLAKFNKACMEAHPEIKAALKEAHKIVKNEIGNGEIK